MTIIKKNFLTFLGSKKLSPIHLSAEKILKASLPILVSLSLLVGVWFFSDLKQINRVFESTQIGLLLVAVFVAISSISLGGLRFYHVLTQISGLSFKLSTTMKINWLVTLVAFAVPAALVADGFRVIWSKLVLNLTVTQSFQTTLFDRFLALLGVLVVGIILLPIQFKNSGDGQLLWVQGIIFGSGLITCAATSRLIGWKFWDKFDYGKSMIEPLRQCIHYLLNWRFLFVQFVIALMVMVFYAFTIWLVAKSFGAQLDLIQTIAIAPIIYLAQQIPIFYMGFGMRELVAVQMLTTEIGVPGEIAFLTSIVVGLVTLFAALPGIFFTNLVRE